MASTMVPQSRNSRSIPSFINLSTLSQDISRAIETSSPLPKYTAYYKNSNSSDDDVSSSNSHHLTLDIHHPPPPPPSPVSFEHKGYLPK
jgi:hypothetical protein